MTTGQKIKTLRNMFNISQTYLAKKANISQEKLSDVESGTSKLTHKELEIIAYELKTLPEVLEKDSTFIIINNPHNNSNVGNAENQNITTDKLLIDLMNEQILHLKNDISQLNDFIKNKDLQIEKLISLLEKSN